MIVIKLSMCRVALFVMTSAAAVVIACGLFRSRSPLARAARVKAASADTIVEEAFEWMPPDHLLGFHGDRQNWSPYAFDVQTGQTQRLEKFHTLALAQHTWPPFWVHSAVSPDGKWLLWGENSLTGHSEYFVAALDGTKIIAWYDQPRQNFCQVAWMADSRAWMLLYRDEKKTNGGSLDHAQVYSLDAPLQTRTVSLRGLPIQPYVIGCLPGNRLITQDGTGKRLSVFALDAPGKTLRNFSVHAHENWDNAQALLSPSGERLAWCVETPLHGFEAETRSALSGNNTEVRLMVSGVDGSNMRELGRFDACRSSHSGNVYSLCAWSADSKRLLLLRDNALWWLPTDE